MAKSSEKRGVVATAKAVPWLMIVTVSAELAKAARAHWADLPPRDRKRLSELLAKSKGRPDKLTQSERDELVGLVRRIDAAGFAKRIAPLLAGVAARRARR